MEVFYVLLNSAYHMWEELNLNRNILISSKNSLKYSLQKTWKYNIKAKNCFKVISKKWTLVPITIRIYLKLFKMRFNIVLFLAVICCFMQANFASPIPTDDENKTPKPTNAPLTAAERVNVGIEFFFILNRKFLNVFLSTFEKTNVLFKQF